MTDAKTESPTGVRCSAWLDRSSLRIDKTDLLVRVYPFASDPARNRVSIDVVRCGPRLDSVMVSLKQLGEVDSKDVGKIMAAMVAVEQQVGELNHAIQSAKSSRHRPPSADETSTAQTPPPPPAP